MVKLDGHEQTSPEVKIKAWDGVNLPYEGIIDVFEAAFCSFLLLDENSFTQEMISFGDQANIESAPNDLNINVSFEELLATPVGEDGGQISSSSFGGDQSAISLPIVLTQNHISASNLNFGGATSFLSFFWQ